MTFVSTRRGLKPLPDSPRPGHNAGLCPQPCFVLGLPRAGKPAFTRARTSTAKAGPDGLPNQGSVGVRNTPLARRLWTGLDDEHLASIVNFACESALEPEVRLPRLGHGRVEAGGRRTRGRRHGQRLARLALPQPPQTGAEREGRSPPVEHGERLASCSTRSATCATTSSIILPFGPTSGAEGHFKGSPRKSRNGQAEIRAVAMAKTDIDELCCAVSDCFESIDDLILKIWFRRRFPSGDPQATAHAYEHAVHGWQNPPFDLGRLRILPKKRARQAEGAEERTTDAAAGGRRRTSRHRVRDRWSGSLGRARAPKVLCRWRKSLSAVQSPLPPCGRAVGGEGRSRQGAGPGRSGVRRDGRAPWPPTR